MERIIMTQKQYKQYTLIKALSENKISLKRVTEALRITDSHVYALKRKFIKLGINAFKNKKIYKEPHNKISDELKKRIIEIYLNDFTDKFSDDLNSKYNANLTIFVEDLKEHYGINISVSFVRELLLSVGIYSPLANRSTKNRINKMNRQKKKHDDDKQIIVEGDYEIEIHDKGYVEDHTCYKGHSRKIKKTIPGEIVYGDASPERYFNNIKTNLHLLVDATGYIVGAHFEEQETLLGYYHATAQMLEKHGAPLEIFTDNKSVFRNPKPTHLRDLHKDTLTQYGVMCRSLGITLNTSSIAEDKAIVERMFHTIQNRLYQDLRRLNVTTIQEANAVLPSLIEKYNSKFNSQVDFSTTYYQDVKKEHIPYYLSVKTPRVVSKGNVINYKNSMYFPDDTVAVKLLTEKTKCLVIETFVGEIYIAIHNNIYKAIELTKENELELQRKFKNNRIRSDRARSFTPAPDHPWRNYPIIQEFIEEVDQQKHISGKIKSEVKLLR